MDGPTNLARIATLTFLGALVLIVVYQALTGKIRLGGLLLKNGAGAGSPRRLSAARAQLLVVTVLAAAAILSFADDPQQVPPWLSAGLPAVVGLSNAVFLWNLYHRAPRPS